MRRAARAAPGRRKATTPAPVATPFPPRKPRYTGKRCPRNAARPAPADSLRAGAGLAAFLGHLFPVYLGFRGGKGVATGAGVVAFLLPGAALAALLIWVATVCATRYVSLSSLAAATTLCIVRVWTTAASRPLSRDQCILTLFCFLAMGLVFLRHHANIARLLH